MAVRKPVAKSLVAVLVLAVCVANGRAEARGAGEHAGTGAGATAGVGTAVGASAVTAAGAAAAAGVGASAPDASSAATLVLHGDSRGIAPCSSCHGASGEGSAAAGFPRLAGFPAPYLLEQLNALADGTRQSPVMGPVARQLSSLQRQELANYYSKLPKAVGGAAVATERLDDQLALRGRWSDDIPACVQCHGERGSGVGSAFPPLAGQSPGYIVSQLQAWKQGTRPGGPLGLMQAISSRLSEQDMHAVADYFAAQPVVLPVAQAGAKP
jgi:cytochrome c553